jgi:hypothetical protein
VRYRVKVADIALTVDQTHHLGQPVFEPGESVYAGIDLAQVRLLAS